MSALEYLSLGDPAFRTDRFSAYQRLRDHNPVARVEPDGTRAVLTRYADVERIFKDPQMRVQPKAGEFPAYLGTGPGATFHKLSLPDLDAPKHTRLRKLASPAFAPRALGHMRSWVERIITDNIEALAAADGEVDFVEHFGMRVPAEIACRLPARPRRRRGDGTAADARAQPRADPHSPHTGRTGRGRRSRAVLLRLHRRDHRLETRKARPRGPGRRTDAG